MTRKGRKGLNVAFIVDLYRRFRSHLWRHIIGTGPRVRSFVVLSHLYYLFDVTRAYIIHGSSLNDYFEYEFYKKSHLERKKFVTNRRARWIFKRLLPPEYRKGIEDKFEINTRYSKFLGREWLYPREISYEEFEGFIRRHSQFLVKPRYSALGRGVTIVDATGADLRQLYLDLRKNDMIVEQLVIQHSKMSALHPSSVNTVRITTVLCPSDDVKVVSAVLRIGSDGSVVDNHAAGGLIANIDIDSGVVYTTAINKFSERFVFHPVTGIQIVGFEIPYWEEVLQLCEEVARILPEVRYMGWDIAITQLGPVLIEGNRQGGMRLQQQPEQEGMFPVYRKIILSG